MRTEKTECRMHNCQRPHIRGECDKNCYYNTRQVMTNADRIRAMSDEELATWLTDFCCATVGNAANARASMYQCGLLKWLKQEASE